MALHLVEAAFPYMVLGSVVAAAEIVIVVDSAVVSYFEELEDLPIQVQQIVV